MGLDLQTTFDAPLLVLYSMTQVEGKLRALLIVSLRTTSSWMVIVNYGRGLLDFISDLRVCLITIPNADYILVRSYTNCAPTYPGPFVWLFVGRRLKIVKLFSKNGEDNVFPQAVGNALLQTNDPLAPRKVEWVFPYRSANTRVKEEVVGCRGQGRRGV